MGHRQRDCDYRDDFALYSRADFLMRLSVVLIFSLLGLLVWTAVLVDFFQSGPIPTAIINSAGKSPIKPSEKIVEPIAAPATTTVTLIAVGDIMLSRTVADRMEQSGLDYPFQKVSSFLNEADIVFGNLETPLIDGRRIESSEMIFRANPAAAGALRRAGFTILSLANNHTPNFGARGLLETFRSLTENDIKYVAAGKNSTEANQPVYLTVNNFTFAFLAYNDAGVVPVSYEATADRPGTAFMRIDKMTAAVKQAKAEADFVIVSMHAGDEYKVLPNQAQIDFARAAVDAGAELVIGHHPHVVQTVERYRGKNIFYSLGNFVFDQTAPATKEGLVAKIIFTKAGVSGLSFHPVLIENLSQPRFIETVEVSQRDGQ